MIRRWPTRDTNASTSVEFAVVGLLLCLVTFGIVETGLLWVVEKRHASHGFISRSPRGNGLYLQHVKFFRTSTSTTRNYAVQTSQAWLFPNMITAANVTVNRKVGSRNGFSSDFF